MKRAAKSEDGTLKKMILVPADIYYSMKQKVNQQEGNTEISKTTMSEILNAHVPEDEKVRQVEAVLRESRLKSESPISNPKPTKVSTEAQTIPVDVLKPYQSELLKVVNSLPPTFRKTGLDFINQINKINPDVLTWTSSGEVVVDSKRILGSNIGEFVELLSRQKILKILPEGIDLFIRTLHRSDTPLSCIINRKLFTELAENTENEDIDSRSNNSPNSTPTVPKQVGSGLRWIPHLLCRK